MRGIFVNENGGIPYAQAIVRGVKPIETRNKNMLSACVGDRVAIIRTRRGKKPMVVGYATITGAMFVSADALNRMRDLTLIPVGSAYDAKGKGKWCYLMDDAREERFPYELPCSAVRHGRSWCEFDYDEAYHNYYK